MSPLVWIVGATVIGGLVSLLLAASVSFTLLRGFVRHMVSFSVGAMLAAALLKLLPEALESGLHPHRLGVALLLGLMLFFMLEKLALWRHAHGEHGAELGHGNSHHHHHHHHLSAAAGGPLKPAAMVVVIGDSMHNFTDGILLAAAFMQDITLGIATTMAVVAHEVPQEIGDFMVLLQAGMSRTRALAVNVATSLTAVAGGVLGFFVLSSVQPWIPYVLVFAAASFLYVAVADVVPALHREHPPSVAPLQLALIAAGVGVVALTGTLLGHPH
jgi:zinc and cadmium transporter